MTEPTIICPNCKSEIKLTERYVILKREEVRP